MTRYVLNATGKKNPWFPDVSQVIFLVAFYFCLTGFFACFDTFWHVKVGEWIWQHKQIPHVDPGFALHDGPLKWLDHEWLSQLLLYGLWLLGGFFGLRVVLGLIPAFVFQQLYVTFRRKGIPPVKAVFLTVIPAALTSLHWLARPHIFAYAWLLLSLYLWKQLSEKWTYKPVVFLVCVQILWVNMHQSFMLQFVIAGAYVVEATLRKFRQVRYKTMGFRQAVFLSLLLVLATGLNAAGFSFADSPKLFLTTRWPISEWQPFDYMDRAFYYFLFYALVLVTGFWANRKKTRIAELLIFMPSCFLAVSAARHMPIFVLLNLFAYMQHIPHVKFGITKRTGRSAWTAKLGAWIEKRNQRIHKSEKQFSGRYLTAALWLVLFVAGTLQARGTLHLASLQGVNHEAFPVKAVDFLKQERITGKMFSDYAWGGYLIFHFGDRNKLFIDGRADMYGIERLKTFIRTRSAREDWREVLADYDIEIILAETEWQLSKALLDEPAWALVYSDEDASVFLRKNKFSEVAKKFPGIKLVEAKEEEK